MAGKGELRIFNQFTETFSVNELAEKVQSAGKTIGLDVLVQSIENPRKELEEHYYNPVHTGLLELGLQPHLLTEEVLVKMLEFTARQKGNITEKQIFSGVRWE